MDICHRSTRLCACLSPQTWGTRLAVCPHATCLNAHISPRSLPFTSWKVIFTFPIKKETGQMIFLSRATFSASFPKQVAVDTLTLHGQKVQVIKRPSRTVEPEIARSVMVYEAVIHFLNSFSFSHLTQVFEQWLFSLKKL